MGSRPAIYVYVDVAFLLNFATDLAWVWVTAVLSGLRPRWWRVALSAAVGAAAAVWAYFPAGAWLQSWPGALLGTGVALALAFRPLRPGQWFRVAAYFIFTGGAMAGMVMLAASRGIQPFTYLQTAVPPGMLVAAGILLCLVAARYLWESARERSRLARGLYGLRVSLEGQEVAVTALLDTGNHLRDPLSRKPVVVVEAAALSALLPPGAAMAAGAGPELLDRLPESWRMRCRLVPFRGMGQPAGMLLAFQPDGLALRPPGRDHWLEVEGLVGLTGQQLHPDGAYRALLPWQLAQVAEGVPGIAWEGETG